MASVGRDHEGDVGLLHLVERGGHADGDAVALRDTREIRGRLDEPVAHERRELVGGNVGDVALPRVDKVGLLRRDLQAHDPVAFLGHLHGQRQADIPESDNAEYRAAVTQLLFE